MNGRTSLFAVAICASFFVSRPGAVTVQDPTDVFPDGSAYLWVEAEAAVGLTNSETTGFTVVDKFNPIQTRESFGDPPAAVVKGGLDVLPTDANVSGGGALFDQIGGEQGPTRQRGN